LGKNRGMPITIEIFNIKGQVTHRTEINDVSSNELARSINLSNYTSGLYLCRVRTGGQATVKKFTILK